MLVNDTSPSLLAVRVVAFSQEPIQTNTAKQLLMRKGSDLLFFRYLLDIVDANPMAIRFKQPIATDKVIPIKLKNILSFTPSFQR